MIKKDYCIHIYFIHFKFYVQHTQDALWMVVKQVCTATHIYLHTCVCVLDSQLGTAEVWTSRQALQDLYQKMLVTDLEYALDKKVEQDL